MTQNKFFPFILSFETLHIEATIPALGHSQKMQRVKVRWRDHFPEPPFKSGHCGQLNIPKISSKRSESMATNKELLAVN